MRRVIRGETGPPPKPKPRRRPPAARGGRALPPKPKPPKPRPTFAAAFSEIARFDAGHASTYTQGANRWEGVAAIRGLLAPHHPIPRLWAGDCSSGYTRWILWALQQHLGRIPFDVVNGEDWHAGYTGTIALHLHRLPAHAPLLVGDAALYGSRWPYVHVTGVLDPSEGLVVSHGGPAVVLERWSYRRDLAGFWRPVIALA